MVTPRLDAPFAATRQYGFGPETFAFDILTLPFQISNMLTGIPPLEIPAFGQGASIPTSTYTPTPSVSGGTMSAIDSQGALDVYLARIAASSTVSELDQHLVYWERDYPLSRIGQPYYDYFYAAYDARRAALLGQVPPAPAGGGITGTFGVVGLAGPSGLGYQSILVGTQTFERVRITWSGQIQNTGNAPLSGATISLNAQSFTSGFIRATDVSLPTLAPGASAPVNLVVELSASDPAGDFMGFVMVLQAGANLGQANSPVLGRIAPVTGISITGTFGA